MHMADALVSPAVAGAMFAASGTALVFAVRSLKKENYVQQVPLMGVLGAFVFAAQMINFSLPGTGSSGHIGGGLLLAALIIGGGLSLLASNDPDGLEWSIERLTGGAEIALPPLAQAAGQIQEKIALFADYALPAGDSALGTMAVGLIGTVAVGAAIWGVGRLIFRRQAAPQR